MAFKKTKMEFYNYHTHEFVSDSVIADFRNKLEQDANLQSLSYDLKKFRYTTCPKCNGSGAFKWHLFGKLKHSDCGWSWYVGPGTYILAQFKAAFRTGVKIGGALLDSTEEKGKKVGCSAATAGFVLWFCIRLPYALIIMVPIQTILYLTQKKPESKAKSAL